MKVLFVSFYNDEAYGVRILHSKLKSLGFDSKIIFLKLNSPRSPFTKIEKQLFYRFVKLYNPDVLAFSLVSPNFKLYQSMYPEIRKLGNFKILIGGWQASLNPIETLKYCDFLCIGEGEEALPELIHKIEYGQDYWPSLHTIPNIWSDFGRNNVRPLTQNLSDYPPKLIDKKNIYYIEYNNIAFRDPYVHNHRYGTIIGRGCPFKCTYCSNCYMTDKLYPNSWSKIRYKKIDHVIEELKDAKKNINNLKCINFYDEVFLPKKEWAEELFSKYKKEINLPFYCMFFPGTCKEELIKIMKPAGLAGVWMGVQSGSERVRKEIFKRYYTNEKVLEQANLFNKYGVNVKYDFILNNPFETKEETEESIQLMKDLPKPKTFNFFSLKFFPHTEITNMALAQKLIKESDLDDQLNIESPKYTISKEEENKILRRIE